MRKLIFQILIILVLTFPVLAQTEQQNPYLFDEFGDITSEDIFARLDGFNYELSKANNSKAIIRISGGGENCYLCHYRQGSYMTAVLKSRILPVKKNSVENNRLGKYSIEYCNENEDLKVQLYLMPPNSTLPVCNKTQYFPKHSFRFQTIYFYSKTQQVTPLENTYVESTSPADGEYSLNALKEAKNILDKSPDSKIYIIVYLGTNLERGYYDEKKGEVEKKIRKLDKKSIAKKLIQNTTKEFVKNGINSSQIKTIEGGYVDDKRKLEFWFVPKGGEIPKPKPDYFPKKIKK